MTSFQINSVPPRFTSPTFAAKRTERKPHLVQFYENEETLSEVVGDFLASGILAGDQLIVIATETHRSAFAEALTLRGCNAEFATVAGQLTFFDAHETLAGFMRDSLPDRDLFHKVAGTLLEKAGGIGRSRNTRAYGEMVDILWQQGNTEAAMQLESLWNELQKTHAFSLLCAYSMASFYKEVHGLNSVCDQHSHYLDSESGAVRAQLANVFPGTVGAEVVDITSGLSQSDPIGRSDQLTTITAAIADAVGPLEVYVALVDQVAHALGASSAGLFMRRENESGVEVIRSVGYSPEAAPALSTLSVNINSSIPAVDVIRDGRPLWIDSKQHLLASYPHLAPYVANDRSYSIGCVPVMVQGRVLASLAFTFDNAPPLNPDQRHFLMLVARYAGQALERLRLLELERRSRAEAEALAARMQQLYRLAASMNAASDVNAVFETALDAVQFALGAERSSILVSDNEGVMRFRAWRGLSEEYRRAVDGHSPWSRDAVDPAPLLIPNVAADPSMSAYMPVFEAEDIAALGFIPLIANGKLIGKFMVYYAEPRAISQQEVGMVRAIADHVAAAIARFAAVDGLRQTIHFNEMFAGILGHDLRNPLSAIIAAAQVSGMRTTDEKLTRPLGRIVSSGHRMSRMIDQLLDFTRVRVGRGIPLELKSFDLAAVMRQVMEEHESARPEWKLSLTQNGDTIGTWDHDRLCQVFSNLIGNSVEHGQQEGGVTIAIDGSLADSLVIAVHNMGEVSAELLPRMFEPMTGGEARHDRPQGLGLGLYITRELVTAHNGQISVRSDAESGTTITVTLPRSTRATD